MWFLFALKSTLFMEPFYNENHYMSTRNCFIWWGTLNSQVQFLWSIQYMSTYILLLRLSVYELRNDCFKMWHLSVPLFFFSFSCLQDKFYFQNTSFSKKCTSYSWPSNKEQDTLLHSKVWVKKNETCSKIDHLWKIYIFCSILMKLGENDYLMWLSFSPSVMKIGQKLRIF